MVVDSLKLFIDNFIEGSSYKNSSDEVMVINRFVK